MRPFSSCRSHRLWLPNLSLLVEKTFLFRPAQCLSGPHSYCSQSSPPQHYFHSGFLFFSKRIAEYQIQICCSRSIPTQIFSSSKQNPGRYCSKLAWFCDPNESLSAFSYKKRKKGFVNRIMFFQQMDFILVCRIKYF